MEKKEKEKKEKDAKYFKNSLAAVKKAGLRLERQQKVPASLCRICENKNTYFLCVSPSKAFLSRVAC